jgi:acyl transferase domain-containing protein
MSRPPREPLAVVGAGCRLPGCHGPDELWELLVAGRDAIGPTPPYRARTRAGADPRLDKPGAARRGALEDVERFDWRAFGMSPRESKYVDPQQRLLLETSWEALEHAGLPLERIAGTRAGVYVGIMWPDYAKLLAENPDQLAGYAVPGTGLALAANRISHCFDLRGPSIALDVQCASSLIAIHLACMALWAGECELALAGGVNLILTPDADVMMSRAGILSGRGRCATFDEDADGFVRSEGAGIVVIEPLSRAVANGDRPLALVHGSAANHDGRGESLTAPSEASQVDLIGAACDHAGVDPTALDYVELHGTATQKGDPLEAAALGRTAAAGRPAGRPCLVGSVKTNIGHCEAAAGVASLLKVTLALHHGELPPTIGPERVNPAIALDELGLEVVTEGRDWPADGSGLAGVTSLSLGGGNAHVVLGAAPASRVDAAAGTGHRLLPLSARTPAALQGLARAYGELLCDGAVGAEQLADICWTAALRRTHHREHRFAVWGRDAGELAERLLELAAQPPVSATDLPSRTVTASRPVFVLSDDITPEEAELARRFVVEPDPEPAASSVTVGLAGTDAESLHAALAELYIAGCDLAWDRLWRSRRNVASLPTYRWDRERLWIDPLPAAVPEPSSAMTA